MMVPYILEKVQQVKILVTVIKPSCFLSDYSQQFIVEPNFKRS